MQASGEFGEFFPAALSPWGYNETVAHEYFPLTPEEARKRNYRWEERTQFSKPDSVTTAPDSLQETTDDILTATLTCTETGKGYRIVEPELRFYRTMNTPVPALSPEARHLRRLRMRTPRKLFERKCSKTGKIVWSTYSPERSERVYSEAAYLEALQ